MEMNIAMLTLSTEPQSHCIKLDTCNVNDTNEPTKGSVIS